MKLYKIYMKLYKIYKYTNLITGMSYIGQTCKTLKQRAGRNMQRYRDCDKFWEAIQHYGTDCWRSEILWDGLTSEEANIYEQVEIRDNETLFPYGYNLSEGGMGVKPSPETRDKIRKANTGKKHSPESLRKMSDAAKGRKLPPDVRKKISESNKGEKHYLFGKTRSTETRRKISEAQKGKTLSEKHRRKISEGNKGRVFTDKTKRKISEANTGRKHSAEVRANMSKAQKSNPSRGMLNKKHSQEARRKMSESRKGMTPWIKGKRHSESTRGKIREARKHQVMEPVSADTREKLRKASTGRTHSRETLQKMSDAAKGRTAWNRSAVWDNAEEIIRLYTVEKLTCNAIAKMYGVSSTPIQNVLRSNGVKLSRSRKPARCDIWNRQSEVVSLYTQEFKSTKEIADMFEVSSATVLKVLRSNGVEELISTKKVDAWRHQDEIINLYTVEMENINEIATIFKTCSDVVSRILESNGVRIRKIENQNHPCYGKPAHNRSPQFTQAHELFLSLPPEMSIVEKRKYLQENVDGVTKDTISRWVQKWANITGIQPTHPDYERTHKFFLSLPADMNLNEKRKFLREKMPHVKRGTIYRWVRKWQSELETHNYVQTEFQFS